MRKEKRPVFQRGVQTHLLVLLEQDLEPLMRWINDQEVTRYLRANFPMSQEGERQFIANRAKDPNNLVFIIGTKGRTPIGLVGLHRIDWVSQVAQLGIMIGEKNHQGKRHGTEAMMLVLEYAFQRLNLRKVELDVYSFNERAQRCYTRCGFVEEGRKRKHMFREGEHHDTIMMGVFKEEWLPAHKAFVEQLPTT